MGKSWKYCLSVMVLVFLFFSCEQIDKFYDQPTQEDKVALANQKYKSLKDTNFLNQEFDYDRIAKYYKTLNEVSDLDPNHASAWMELADGYLSRGMVKEWKIHFDKALFLDPVKYQGRRGYTLLFFFKDYEKALADFNGLEVINPNGTDYVRQTNVNYLKALCYMQLKDYNNALKYFDRYIEEESKSVGEDFMNEAVYLYKGIIFQRIKDYEQALLEYEKGQKLNPGFADFHFQISKLHYERQEYKQALKSIALADDNYTSGNYNKSWHYKPFESIQKADIDQLRYDINLKILELVQ